jgi:hypothetical protein
VISFGKIRPKTEPGIANRLLRLNRMNDIFTKLARSFDDLTGTQGSLGVRIDLLLVVVVVGVAACIGAGDDSRRPHDPARVPCSTL